MVKLFLQRTRFNLRNLFAKKIVVPTNFKSFKYTNPKYHQLLTSYLLSNTDEEINYSKKIFGKETDDLVTSKDIFSGNDFQAQNKFIPAYFDKGDVKVPYEASRLQFLQKLDLLSILNKEKNSHENVDVNKFPLIYWNSPMDVAIRNINLIFHRNFLEKNDLDSKILGNNKDLIDTYISQHYQFITENLENNGNVVGNHYLIELCSIILTLATYKFDGHEDDTRYYLNELNKELNRQFYKDGTNFEGSSHYSAFVTEALIIFKLSLDTINWDVSGEREYLLTGKPTVKFNEIEDFQLIRLIKKIVFSNRNFLNLLMVNGELSQIGDNDSGRLFYFYHDEDEPLKMNWLINLIDHFFNFEIEKNLGKGFKLIHSEDINSVSGSKMVSKASEYIESLGLGTTEPKSDFYSLKKLGFSVTVDPVDLTSFSKVDHPSIKIFQNDFNLYSFPDFGIFIWRNNDGSEYFSIRCGQIGQNSVGGHSHYDQLAIECFADGKWLARDPGTGTYTDDIETRNEFRSMKFHWGPNADIKFPKESEFDCFKLNYMEDGKLLFLDKNNFLGSAVFNGNKIYRKILIENGSILISDFSNDTNLYPYQSWGELNKGVKFKFSKGYKRIN